MKIILINPQSDQTDLGQQKCYPPLSLLYLANSLLKQNHQVKIVEANALDLSIEDIVIEVKDYAPDLVGIPLYSQIIHSVYCLIKKLHQEIPDIKTVLGGPDASALPDKTLQEFREVDFILRGEAEESIVSLCRYLEGKIPVSKVNGLSYKQNGGIFHNPDSKKINNLDGVILPKQKLLSQSYKQQRYYNIIEKKPIDTLITSRGCPYHCGFCYNTDHTYRFRSADDVMEEIYQIYSKGIENIEICDDNFTVIKERAIKVFDLIKKEKIKVSFIIKSRVDKIDEEFLKKAKSAGVIQISYGSESGVQSILDKMNKKITVEQNEKAIRLTNKLGIRSHTSWILGYPGETPQTIKSTVDFIIKIKPVTANILSLIPYPETRVYQQAKQERTLVGDWNSGSDYVPWIKLPWMEEKEDLEKYVRWAKHKLYFRPYYIRNFSSYIIKNRNYKLAKYAFKELASSLLQTKGF